MKRVKRHAAKRDFAETSSSSQRDNEEHDLAYYIHDRVELMHQVFSVIKMKEIKSMIPMCVKNLSSADLQELCTEELLGISSKRLCAILDGAEPPSDTESSSSSMEHVEAISLDSISSDEEILSQHSSKSKKHKHRRRSKKGKHKKRETEKENDGREEQTKASRAGLTVLELLELQARARAIRAQLQNDQLNNCAPEVTVQASGSDDEVEIKEEPAEVVEISSEDEKPNVEELTRSRTNALADKQKQKTPDNTNVEDNPKTITKRINDLIITVPQTKQTRKIKLKRNKVEASNTVTPTETVTPSGSTKQMPVTTSNEADKSRDAKKNKSKKNKDTKKEKIKKDTNKDGSDHDEITLQLSDSEKMDLLEDLDRKNYDAVSSSSKDSEGSSDSDSSSDSNEENKQESTNEIETKVEKMDISDEKNLDQNKHDTIQAPSNTAESYLPAQVSDETNTAENDKSVTQNEIKNIDLGNQNNNDIPELSLNKKTDENNSNKSDDKPDNSPNEVNGKDMGGNNEKEKLSEGELSDHTSSEVEVNNAAPVIVCISDDEKVKKKKKKEKKSKKKTKYDDTLKATEKGDIQETHNRTIEEDRNKEVDKQTPTVDNDEINAIFELSDDSSCYEVEGISILSKEPTTEEIEALSAKIDNIQDIVADKDIVEEDGLDKDSIRNISWKDRYLDSKKVKRVLKTSNILNAMRKKNKELKRKLEETKKAVEKVVEKTNVEGTIEEYNTLEASTKYVDPVSEQGADAGENVSKEMEKDAKQLLKMYKKLLKYNDMNKTRDPNKKKKKKSKKSKEKNKEKSASSTQAISMN